MCENGTAARGSGEPAAVHGVASGDMERPTDLRTKTRLTCPCGTAITGTDEDDLVAKTQMHLTESHPGMDYSCDEILFIAY